MADRPGVIKSAMKTVTVSRQRRRLKPKPLDLKKRFSLTDRVAVITGGAGFLGRQHAEAIAEAGGIPVLLDIQGSALRHIRTELAQRHGGNLAAWPCDITRSEEVQRVTGEILK